MLPVTAAATALVSVDTFKGWLDVKSSQSRALSALTGSGAVATAVLTGHGFRTNAFVVVAGAADATYNGSFLITVVDADTFTYPLPTPPVTSPAGGSPTVTPDDGRYAAMVEGASAELEQQTGVYFVIRSVTETLDGNGKTQLVLRWAPVAALTSVVVNGSAITTGNVVVDGDRGILTWTAGVFPQGLRNVVVTYDAGFDVQDGPALPRDIVRACLDLAKAIHDELVTGAIAASSVNLGPSTFVLKPSKFPPSVQRVLDSWEGAAYRA